MTAEFISLNISQKFSVTAGEAEELLPLYRSVILRFLRQHVQPADLDDACQEAVWLAFTESWERGTAGHVYCAKRAAFKWLHNQMRLRDRRQSVIELDDRRVAKNGGPERVELREVCERIDCLPEPQRSLLIVAAENGHIPGDWREEAGLSKGEANKLLNEARTLLGARRQRRKIRAEVVRLLQAGWPTIQIAERFGINRTSVTNIAAQEHICLRVNIGDRTGLRLARNIGAQD